MPELHARIGEAVGSAPVRLSALPGGCVGEVHRAELEDGSSVVVKVDRSSTPRLDIEAGMLQTLESRSDLPVPRVILAEPDLLIMEHIEHDGARSDAGERQAADLIAALHAIPGEGFGLETDTLIGSLHQPNPWTSSWVSFFRDHRLLTMAGEAARAGRLAPGTMTRLESLCGKLDEHIDEPERPSLLHGDIWSGNVLWRAGTPVAFIDPAVYYGHPEIELAFISLFGCFAQAFWDRYRELRPMRPGFQERAVVYNLYPLLVHARLFAGGYEGQVRSSLSRLGC